MSETHCTAVLDEVKLHYVAEGNGPPVVLLHGFPEFWYSWRRQLPVLAAGGFRAVAPDMRGYNLSSKPEGVHAYHPDRLAHDVSLLIRHLGPEPACLVGHDWGGVVAWWVAMQYPELVDRLVIMNAPHPARFLRSLLSSWRQLLRSWYVFFFQLPWLPEQSIHARGYAVLRAALQHGTVRPGAFTNADLDRYVEAMSQPGALTAAINYYRAAVRSGPTALLNKVRPVKAPVLVIWGEQDRFLLPELAEPDPKWVPRARVERLPQASHWVQLDQPERVNQLLLDFLHTPTQDLVRQG